jgi:hypothetical protein
MPYLENYLRLFAFHRHHAREAMLQDLQVMDLMAEGTQQGKEGAEPQYGLLHWLAQQRSNLLNP